MPTLGRTGITGVHDYVIVWRVVQDRADNDQIRRAVTGLAVFRGPRTVNRLVLRPKVRHRAVVITDTR
jgi:hypothetical protein